MLYENSFLMYYVPEPSLILFSQYSKPYRARGLFFILILKFTYLVNLNKLPN